MGVDYFFSLERPLHALPDAHQVRAANLQGWWQLVSRRGGNPGALAKKHGIPVELAGEEGFVDFGAMAALLEACAEALDDPLFGVHLAQVQQPDIFGCIAALCRAAPNVRESIARLVEFLPVLHTPEYLLELVEGRAITEFRWSLRSDVAEHRQVDCHSLAMMLKTLRMLAGTGFQPDHLLVPRGLFGSLRRELERAMACGIRSGGSQVGIAFASSALDLPVPSANGPLYELLLGYMRRLRIISRKDIIDSVSDYVYRELSFGGPSIRGCADSLGLAQRTLQFRLKSRGLSFSDILDQQRLRRAKSILRNTDMSIGDIADHLGYGERTSFGRAFKRWTGLSPQQYRQRGAQC